MRYAARLLLEDGGAVVLLGRQRAKLEAAQREGEQYTSSAGLSPLALDREQASASTQSYPAMPGVAAETGTGVMRWQRPGRECKFDLTQPFKNARNFAEALEARDDEYDIEQWRGLPCLVQDVAGRAQQAASAIDDQSVPTKQRGG